MMKKLTVALSVLAILGLAAPAMAQEDEATLDISITVADFVEIEENDSIQAIAVDSTESASGGGNVAITASTDVTVSLAADDTSNGTPYAQQSSGSDVIYYEANLIANGGATVASGNTEASVDIAGPVLEDLVGINVTAFPTANRPTDGTAVASSGEYTTSLTASIAVQQ